MESVLREEANAANLKAIRLQRTLEELEAQLAHLSRWECYESKKKGCSVPTPDPSRYVIYWLLNIIRHVSVLNHTVL